MKPTKLYIENFMCHEKSFIDFREFNSALIVGIKEHNDLFSNGVGKTSIFKAIEYILFNQADINLEKIIRDGADTCTITLDFLDSNQQEYRLIRKRNKKNTDLSLYQRTTTIGSEEQVYHNSNNFIPVTEELYWKDLSGRRASDTEKDLEKLIKINFKSFRNTIHFLQNDFSGLTTSTPEKRKSLFKDALNLVIYSKLEKIAKDKANVLIKNIDRHIILIDNMGTPDVDVMQLQTQLQELQLKLQNSSDKLIELQSLFSVCNDKIVSLNSEIYNTTTNNNNNNNYTEITQKEKNISQEISRIEISLKEYATKKSNMVKLAKDVITEIDSLKKEQIRLVKLDYAQADILLEKVNEIKSRLTEYNLIIRDSLSLYEELKIPVPDQNVCKYCRQPLTEEHKIICRKQLKDDIEACQNRIQHSKKEIGLLEKEINKYQTVINTLTLSKQKLDNINIQITSKKKELLDRQLMHDEYQILFTKFTKELEEKNQELEVIKTILISSNDVKKTLSVKKQIEIENKKLQELTEQINICNKQINHFNASAAVLQHSLTQKNNEINKLKELKKSLKDLESQYKLYPLVIQAFSEIPNLITQDVLDDLQTEANNLLSQLKPGLQLSFKIEKTKADGSETDTLEIGYHINGKDRYYEQLSGAMKLAVTFSLKLGLSFLLQKMVGTDIKFLLLDEIDQSLDKASVDAFADIVKFFQKDFIILIITHNDRLKDKFSHAILVEQDINMVSKAKVVSSW